MSKLGYLARRVMAMDFRKMRSAAKIIHGRTGKPTLLILVDMIKCGIRFQAGYMDYLVFEMYTINDAQRATYITRGRNNRYVALLNPQEYWYLLEDKVEFLKRFDGLQHRDWLDLRTSSFDEFARFCQAHSPIVAKPLDSTCGSGIEFIAIDGQDLEALYKTLLSNQQILIEEMVVQHDDLNRIYPNSVNTLRLVTIRNGDVVYVVFSSIRIGNGKQVDNLNSGGMAAIVDENGYISKPGADKDCKAYDKHPMTGTVLVGQKIPFYAESVELVKKAAMMIPELGYIAWDVAVAQDGPLLIEANHFPGHDIYQLQMHLGPDKLGLAPRFDKAIAGLANTPASSGQ